jgi:hypothetical protein
LCRSVTRSHNQPVRLCQFCELDTCTQTRANRTRSIPAESGNGMVRPCSYTASA